MQRLKNLAQNLALLCASLVVAGLIAELVLRFSNPLGFRIKGDKIVLPANAKYKIRNTRIAKLDPIILHSKNSLGFRGDEPPPTFDDYLSIVTVGGSTTECLYLSDGETWTDALGRRLAGPFERLWVNNAGLDGHSTFGHLVLMEDYILRLKPKVVLFLLGINDMAKEEANAFDDRMMRQPTDLRGVANWATAHSELAALSLNLARYARTLWIGVGHWQVDLSTAPTLELSPRQSLSIKKRHEAYLAPYAQRLTTLIQLARDGGMEPVLITQPALYGDGKDASGAVNLASLNVRGIDGKTQWQVLEMYNDVTRRIGARLGVPVIDAALDLPKDARYYYDLAHYTREGAERIADVIYSRLCPHLAEKFGEYQVAGCGPIAQPQRTSRVSG